MGSATTDREAVADLCDRYLCLLDEGVFDESIADTIFTKDVQLTFPPGSHRGIAGLNGFTEKFMGHWAHTHHHPGHYRVELNGDLATITFSVLATHVHRDSPPPPASGKHFQLGCRFDATAVRTTDGWRLARMTMRVAWTTGIGVPAIAKIMTTSR